MSKAQDFKAKALEIGFDLVGITEAVPIEREQFIYFTDWLAFGYAGRMDYMHRNLDKRTNPARLLEDARSVICVGLNYKPPADRGRRGEGRRPMGKVANYARYEDYHVFVKKELRKLVDFISSAAGGEHKFKICVDSVPLAERAFAVRAGLGFIGKNHMLINPTIGPQILLGEIITSLELKTDGPLSDSCRGCNKCIEACPTGALRADGQFDANRCISYLTIEYKGQMDAGLAGKTGDWLFGCDECVLACPYQENGPVCKNKEFKYYHDRTRLDLGRILNMTEAKFEAEFADSPIKRPGLERLKRNSQICFVNASGRGA
ncbi:MAG: tRNA epoxyqueuosine(34) reductase QueG [Phycisphaerae bacterium]|nr:tRNA epoxyqueuosine(34) reductase QueG [Phycisphaerae bacterium]NIP53896.1 tRNA epoxyqueuosine(34) reductase QueG [Phycisphaerae bacterium]NIS53058.1 tRNA epoxyqueuosine(34) reductase QueG [Phycisphaerae bacterium]NIU10579.1 tRNA epoxyqueuosine(34) reductase QueG [Phycisphaerae bacterium]NIU58323.1 tRNA epoxyqueuosine(34) reductase QueG [Phycisphaerae bacterium]